MSERRCGKRGRCGEDEEHSHKQVETVGMIRGKVDTSVTTRASIDTVNAHSTTLLFTVKEYIKIDSHILEN